MTQPRSDSLLPVFAALFAVDLAVPFVLGPFRPGYSLVHDTLSTLGHGSGTVARITSAWLILFGLGLAAATIWAWRRAAGGWRRAMVFSGLLAFAIGAGVLSGLFPEDLPGTPETRNGKIHGIGAGIGTLWFLAALPVGAGLAQGRARALIWGLTALAWGGFALFLAAKAPEPSAGLWQKLTLSAGYLGALMILRDRGPRTG